MADKDQKFEARVAHLVGCASQWGRDGGEPSERLTQALKELYDYYYADERDELPGRS